MYVYVYVYLHLYLYIHIYMHLYMSVYGYAYTEAHTHIRPEPVRFIHVVPSNEAVGVWVGSNSNWEAAASQEESAGFYVLTFEAERGGSQPQR